MPAEPSAPLTFLRGCDVVVQHECLQVYIFIIWQILNQNTQLGNDSNHSSHSTGVRLNVIARRDAVMKASSSEDSNSHRHRHPLSTAAASKPLVNVRRLTARNPNRQTEQTRRGGGEEGEINLLFEPRFPSRNQREKKSDQQISNVRNRLAPRRGGATQRSHGIAMP